MRMKSTHWTGKYSEKIMRVKKLQNMQCFPKVARVADHFNRVADQLPHFTRPNDPQNLNWGEEPE